MIASARRLSRELNIRDEVDHRLRLRNAQLASGAATEEIREVHAQLRLLAADPSAPPALQAQLRVLAERLARGRSGGPAAALSIRELDVLAQVALGCTNAEVAKRLSLKLETVKSYLRSASAKLGAHTRHEAVAKARRAQLLP
jgi:DNA-binding CsgD family transcriptional regulator